MEPQIPVPLRLKFAGYSVHALTASGAVLGFLALLAAIDHRFVEMFIWLGIALFVDGIDGTFARRANVKETAIAISGDTLDLVVDYVTYVLVPALAMFQAGLFPLGWGTVAAGAICLTAALYFADVRMKTDDWYFRGFPAVWNLFAFFAFLLKPEPWITFGLVILFSGLTFAPIAFVHPMRVVRLKLLTLLMLGAGTVLAVAALFWNLDPPGPVVLGLLVVGAYFLLFGLFRPKSQD
ncbi:CDP-alcohol phosphatidyltransferase family protein [Flaviflagellibacter deserti]|jgi:phosphatidylcholine synthase|uniref:Phosphatidylcholine synthase n=1 Tax=Flaviflagellibacter deserti TaxID=2267266 RepID=A0ABV9Z122_9HYPH